MTYVNTATQEVADRIFGNTRLANTIDEWIRDRMRTYTQFCELVGCPVGTIDAYSIIAERADYLYDNGEIDSRRHAKVTRYINAEGYDTDYLKHHNALSQGECFTSLPKEGVIMKLETKHYVNGTDVKSLSTEARIDLIRDTEKRIADLRAIATQSTTVAREIAKCEEFLTGIVALFDAN